MVEPCTLNAQPLFSWNRKLMYLPATKAFAEYLTSTMASQTAENSFSWNDIGIHHYTRPETTVSCVCGMGCGMWAGAMILNPLDKPTEGQGDGGSHPHWNAILRLRIAWKRNNTHLKWLRSVVINNSEFRFCDTSPTLTCWFPHWLTGKSFGVTKGRIWSARRQVRSDIQDATTNVGSKYHHIKNCFWRKSSINVSDHNLITISIFLLINL